MTLVSPQVRADGSGAPVDGPRLTLVSHELCPYVQRAAIALTEKGVPFERVYVDLANKPEWFRALSPLGKVPLLRVSEGAGDEALFESAVIVEYLEETQPHPLHPSDPLARARHRGWIEVGSAILNGIARLYNAADEDGFAAAGQDLRGRFERLEAELAAREAGPFFAGDAFSLVDAVYGPIFRYFDTFEAQAGLRLLDGLPQIEEWRAALAARDSVRKAVGTDYPEQLTAFLKARKSWLGAVTHAKAV